MSNLIVAAKLYFLGAGLYFIFVYFVKNGPKKIIELIHKENKPGYPDERIQFIALTIGVLFLSFCLWWGLAISGLFKSLKGVNVND